MLLFFELSSECGNLSLLWLKQQQRKPALHSNKREHTNASDQFGVGASGCLPMEILPCNICSCTSRNSPHYLLATALLIYPPGNKHIHRNNAFACSFLG
ncbi:hypothetical protein V6N12_040098 [Hibiscus sabdariffa]|uniref:Uncharacterized protein n=1 Tax=Hibiscus sabdariffa TaxID=183260 RepID=A0ABR2E2P7_9ROSI